MRKKMVWRYYCDYCKTSKGTKKSMEHHEERCTMNPNRKCGLCAMVGGGYGQLEEGLSALKPYGDFVKKPDEAWGGTLPRGAEQKLRDAVDNCPVCMLAAIRQFGLETGQMPGFDYESESKSHYSDSLRNINGEKSDWLCGFRLRGF